jgi:DNA-binding NtrC family response regulator
MWTMPSESLLVVDDDPLIRGSLFEMLQGKGYQVEMAQDGREALQHLNRRSFNLILTDWKMPELDGFSLLDQIKISHPQAAVIIITGFGSIDSAVEAMRRGATDFLTKPIQPHELEETIQRALEHVREPSAEPAPGDPFSDLIGTHPSVTKLCEMIKLVAANPTTVLLEGESGTGKRVVAHAIHRSDPKRWDQSFVEVSCGALPETLLESELFGHVRGAFTGAIRDKEGRFELANGGTILLDEIDSFSPALQVKLLRVLQERTFERVGDSTTQKVDVRIIAATNRNLQELVRQGKFREDLYYRLNVIALRIPPLRERVSDIPMLADYFLKRSSAQAEKSLRGLSEEALAVLCNYSWPGNVRELENVMERAVILAQHPKIMPADLPDSLQNQSAPVTNQDERFKLIATPEGIASLKQAMQDPEREIIVKAIAEANGNRSLAAKKLGIHRSTLYHKLRKLSLDPE